MALPIIAFRAHHVYLAGVRTAVVLREQIVFAIKPQKAEEVAYCIHMQLGCTNHVGRLHVPHHQLFTRQLTTHPPSVVVVFSVINRAFNIRAAEPTRLRLERQRGTHGKVERIEIHTQSRGVLHPNAQGPHGSVFRHGRIGLFEKVKRGIEDFPLHRFAGVLFVPISAVPQVLNVGCLDFNNGDGFVPLRL